MSVCSNEFILDWRRGVVLRQDDCENECYLTYIYNIMARGYFQCLSRCLCITVPPPPVFRHHVFSPRIPSPRISLMHDTTCFWSATDSNRIIIIISLARPLTYCGRDIWNCSKVNEPFLS